MYPSSRTFQHTLLFNNDTTNNPSDSKLDHQDPSISSSLFHFPSLYEEAVTELTWQQLHDLFFHQQSSDQRVLNISMAADLPKTNNASDVNESGITTEKMNITRKRTSKKDRHSKINTAHGPRDRRMRLSLEVARKFFDLQDTLGFDKASKTVEWLLTQSNYAIKEVMGNMPLARGTGGGGGTANSVSSTTSECEAVSGIDESGTTNENQLGPASISVKLKIKNKEKKACRTALHKVARESRKNARERAKKRTMEKKRFINNGQEIMDHSYLLNRSSYEESGGGIQLGTKFNNHQSNSYDQGLKEAVDYAAAAAAADHSNLGNWNFPQNAHEISHEQHFTSDFDNYCGKPWEATCNNL